MNIFVATLHMQAATSTAVLGCRTLCKCVCISALHQMIDQLTWPAGLAYAQYI